MNVTIDTSTLAKLGGWIQFILQLIVPVVNRGIPHGFTAWATLIGSLLAAIGIHAASNTGGTPPAAGGTLA